jgi:hypothetical protein
LSISQTAVAFGIKGLSDIIFSFRSGGFSGPHAALKV